MNPIVEERQKHSGAKMDEMVVVRGGVSHQLER